jgi:hypothetical protein
VRSAGFALLCVFAVAAILVPAARAQKTAPAPPVERDARTLAQKKIDPNVLSAIYGRRGDAKRKVAVPTAQGRTVQVDRHGRALVDVRAQVRPELEKKIKALGGIVVTTSRTYDSIVGWMPLQTLERLAADPGVRAIERATAQ